MTGTHYKPQPRTAARIKDATWLLDDVGVHPAVVAERLGVTIDNLYATFLRAGIIRQDLDNERVYQRQRRNKS